jgi:2-polyprenyl-6-methoxyphenol hydroxylase-like FAD-dependent oxidoreductase
VRLEADLEMHLAPHRYVGLTQLADGIVNVCGLYRRPASAGDGSPHWQQQLRGTPGTLLHERLNGAEFDESSFSAVAGLDLRPQHASGSAGCRLGDALTMIPPFTGNGMSMAFESAELAVEPLLRWSHGDAEWVAAQDEIARRCDATFSRRLRWARWLQRLMFLAPLQGSLVCCLTRPEWGWRFLFERTR